MSIKLTQVATDEVANIMKSTIDKYLSCIFVRRSNGVVALNSRSFDYMTMLEISYHIIAEYHENRGGGRFQMCDDATIQNVFDVYISIGGSNLQELKKRVVANPELCCD